MNLKKLFLNHCEVEQYEINQNQLDLINCLENYYKTNFKQNFFSKIFKKDYNKLGFYLVGDVGVGKTMILNFFFNELKNRKLRLHFNEFMIEFHNYIFHNEDKEVTTTLPKDTTRQLQNKPIIDNISSEELIQKRLPGSCQVMLGPRYALLQSEYSELRKRIRRRNGPIRSIFVSFGGSDNDNLTGLVVDSFCCLELKDISLDVAIGPNYLYKEKPNQHAQ